MASIARVRCVEDTRRDDDELAASFGAKAGNGGSRRGGQLALFDITPDSRNRLTERALRRAMSHRAACT
jgi:hypothetical protein